MKQGNENEQRFRVDALNVVVAPDRKTLGRLAAEEATAHLRKLLATQEEVRVVFAAAPSQLEMLAALIAAPDIDWSRVTAFHMDEYIGLPAEADQRFGRFLERHMFRHVPLRQVHYLDGGDDPEEACRRYGQLLAEAPIDMVLLGIGENGHIAFNDPPVADFKDPLPVKVVELEEACRIQQVNDQCFAALGEVPTHAMTLTVPALFAGKALFCSVPGPTKRQAVMRTLEGPIGEACPSTILRQHPHCTLYVDHDSYDIGSRQASDV